MSSAAHGRSVAAELGGMLGAAFATGAVFAWLASLLVQRRLDPLPALPPAPRIRVPIGLIGLTGLALFVAAILGAVLVQWRADRAHVAEVIRRAD